MRPRRERRGEPHICAPSWLGSGRFNAATRAGAPWRTTSVTKLSIHGVQLQCGHGASAVENRNDTPSMALQTRASSRPQRIRRGERRVHRALFEGLAGRGASMRPRRLRRGEQRIGRRCGRNQLVRGNQLLHVYARPQRIRRGEPFSRTISTADMAGLAVRMRPRRIRRGEPCPPEEFERRRNRLQCGHRQGIRRERRNLVRPPLFAPDACFFQCGHGQRIRVVENQESLSWWMNPETGASRLQCGARANSPWRTQGHGQGSPPAFRSGCSVLQCGHGEFAVENRADVLAPRIRRSECPRSKASMRPRRIRRGEHFAGKYAFRTGRSGRRCFQCGHGEFAVENGDVLE